MKLGMYIMAPKPNLTSYIINPFRHSVCLYVYPPIAARQRFGKNVTPASNTQETIEELLDSSFSTRSVLCQGK
jgi:hypothetical protein